MGQMIGPAIEFAIGQALRSTHQRDSVRGAFGLGLEQFVDAGVPRILSRGPVPFHQHLVPRGLAHQWKFRDPLFQQPGHGRVVEQFSAVIAVQQKSIVGLGHIEIDVKIDEMFGVASHLDLESLEVQAASRPADVEGQVRQRHTIRIARQVEFADQAAERIWVLEPVQYCLPHGSQIIAEILPGVETAAQRQQIRAVAHEVLRAAGDLSRRRRADHEVVLTAQPVQQQVEPGQQRGEGRAVAFGAEAS